MKFQKFHIKGHTEGKLSVQAMQLDEGFHCVKELGEGEDFGEMALIKGGSRAARIVAHEDCHLAVLGQDSYKEILQKRDEANLLRKMHFFTTVEIFKDWSFNQLKNLYLNS